MGQYLYLSLMTFFIQFFYVFLRGKKYFSIIYNLLQVVSLSSHFNSLSLQNALLSLSLSALLSASHPPTGRPSSGPLLCI